METITVEIRSALFEILVNAVYNFTLNKRMIYMKIIQNFYKAIYFITGIVSFVIGLWFLTARQFFYYHAQATGMKWEQIDGKLQLIILALMKVGGTGYIALSLFLMIFTITGDFEKKRAVKLSIPGIALFFYCGIFGITFYVHQLTNANTPWVLPLIEIAALVIAMILSFIKTKK